MVTRCREGVRQDHCCDADGGLGCDGGCVTLAVMGCGVCASDASIVVFGTVDLSVGVVWRYCVFIVQSVTANW